MKKYILAVLAVALLIVCAVFLLKDEKKTATLSSSATPVAFDKSSVLHPALQGLALKETLFTQRVQENPYQGVQELLSMIEVLEKRAGKMEGLEISRQEGLTIRLHTNPHSWTTITIHGGDNDFYQIDMVDFFRYRRPGDSGDSFEKVSSLKVFVYKDGLFKASGDNPEKVRRRFVSTCGIFERFYDWGR